MKFRSRPEGAGFFVGSSRGGKPAAVLEIGEEGAEFAFGVLVMLVDRELEGGFEERAGCGAAVERKEKFAEEDARHHPIGLFGDAEFVVRNRVRGATGAGEGLREAEAEEFVVGLLRDEFFELGDAIRHASEGFGRIRVRPRKPSRRWRCRDRRGGRRGR